MEEFYRQKHPNLPDEYYGVMARYSTGNPITKKEVKNSVKKVKKDPKKKLLLATIYYASAKAFCATPKWIFPSA